MREINQRRNIVIKKMKSRRNFGKERKLFGMYNVPTSLAWGLMTLLAWLGMLSPMLD